MESDALTSPRARNSVEPNVDDMAQQHFMAADRMLQSLALDYQRVVNHDSKKCMEEDPEEEETDSSAYMPLINEEALEDMNDDVDLEQDELNNDRFLQLSGLDIPKRPISPLCQHKKDVIQQVMKSIPVCDAATKGKPMPAWMNAVTDEQFESMLEKLTR